MALNGECLNSLCSLHFHRYWKNVLLVFNMPVSSLFGASVANDKNSVVTVQILDFRGVRKISKSYVSSATSVSLSFSVCLSFGPFSSKTRLPLGGFSWSFIFEEFSKYDEQIQGSLKCGKKNGYLHEDLYTFMTSNQIFLSRRNILDENYRENKNTNTLHDQQLSPETRAVYDIMWKIIVNPDRPQMTMHAA